MLIRVRGECREIKIDCSHVENPCTKGQLFKISIDNDAIYINPDGGLNAMKLHLKTLIKHFITMGKMTVYVYINHRSGKNIVSRVGYETDLEDTMDYAVELFNSVYIF